MKTLIAVNTLTAVSSQSYASHMNLAFRMAKETNDEFILFNGWRCSIDRFRNEAAKIALQQNCDFLLFLDDDVLIPRNTYTKLRQRMVTSGAIDIITPVVYIRSYPFKPMFFKSIQFGEDPTVGLTYYEDWEKDLGSDNLLEVAAIGFSCCLLRVSLLQEIQPAWFVTGTDHTEDVYFCVKAKQTLALRGKYVGIFVDNEVHAGHLLDPEFIATDTLLALKNFYEEMNPRLKEIQHGDHASDYVEKNLLVLKDVEEMKVDI